MKKRLQLLICVIIKEVLHEYIRNQAVFYGESKQPYTDEDGKEHMIDTIWIYYDDMSFIQYAEVDDEMIPFSIGTYSFEDGGDFIYESGEADYGDIIINRTRKYKAGVGLEEHVSSHTYDLNSLGFKFLTTLDYEAML